MSRRYAELTVLLAFAAAAGCAQAAGTPGGRPSILWIMMDDGRADAVGCYGKPWARTPHMDRLAAGGVRFDVAIVQNPVCVPSRRSMKTGFYSHQAGPVAMGKPPAKPGAYIDAAGMKKINASPDLLSAWSTAGMKPVNVGKVHARRQSFDHRGDVPAFISVGGRLTKSGKEAGYPAPDTFGALYTKTHHWMIGGVSPVEPEQTRTWRVGDKGVAVLRELASKKEPFFLRVSFHAPHVACVVPKPYFIDPGTIDLPLPTQEELDGKPAFERGPIRTYAAAPHLTPEQIGICRGTYYGMVSLVDTQVGRLLRVLESTGRLKDTIVAINSDQGFQLGEHGMWKKRVFYEQNVRVPFILHAPGRLPAGKVVAEPVEMVDFLPTLMALSGLEVPKGIRGRSLMPLIEGKVATWREACFSEIDHSQSMYQELRQGTGRRVMVRTKDWKLIFFMDDRVKVKDGALYDLINDPGEKVNRYRDPACRKVIERLEKLAQAWDRGE